MAVAGMKEVIRNDEYENNYYMFGQNDYFNRPCLCPKCIEGAKKYISVTTTGEKMIVALSDTPVGIDGEYLPRYEGKTDYSMLADRFFSGEEAEYIRAGATVVDEKDRFMKIWIRKEAFVKCSGKGVADFPNFSVVDGDKLLSKVGHTPIRKFSISFPGCEDYIFAIAGELK